MAIPTITLYTGDAPIMGQPDNVFAFNAQTFILWQENMPVEMNAAIAAINDLTSTVIPHAETHEFGGTDVIDPANLGENGVAELDASGHVKDINLPPLAITEDFVVNSEAEQLALTVQQGDVAVRTDISETYMRNSGTAGDMTDWTQLLFPIGVVSFNGRIGIVQPQVGDYSTWYAQLGQDASFANLTVENTITLVNPSTPANTSGIRQTDLAGRNILDMGGLDGTGAFMQLFGGNDSESPFRAVLGSGNGIGIDVKSTGVTITGDTTVIGKTTTAGAASSVAQGANANDFALRGFVEGLDAQNAKLNQDASFANLTVKNAITFVNPATPVNTSVMEAFNGTDRNLLFLFGKSTTSDGAWCGLFGGSDSVSPNTAVIASGTGKSIEIDQAGTTITGDTTVNGEITTAGAASSVAQGTNANDFARRDFVEGLLNPWVAPAIISGSTITAAQVGYKPRAVIVNTSGLTTLPIVASDQIGATLRIFVSIAGASIGMVGGVVGMLLFNAVGAGLISNLNVASLGYMDVTYTDTNKVYVTGVGITT